MAKQRQNNSIKDAISAVTTAIRAEADGSLTAEQKSAVVNNAMDIVDTSGFVTMAENADDAIELQHQIAEQIEAEQENQEEETPEQEVDDDQTLEDTL